MHDDKTPHPPSREQTRRAQQSVLATLASTTWRMVIPSVLAVGLGLYLDLHWGTKPWLTLLGVALGLVASAFLIKQQLRDIS